MRDPRHPDDLLSAFLDDELDESSASRVTRHLADCPQCERELDGLRQARTALRALPNVDAPARLFEAVPGEAVRAGSRARGRLVATGLLTFVGAVLATAFVVGGVETGEVVPPVQLVVVDHVLRTGDGPVIQPVDLDR